MSTVTVRTLLVFYAIATGQILLCYYNCAEAKSIRTSVSQNHENSAIYRSAYNVWLQPKFANVLFFPIFRALTGVGIQIQMVGLLCDILIFKES